MVKQLQSAPPKKAVKKPPVVVEPPPQVEEIRDILYPDIQVKCFWEGSADGAMSYDIMKAILGWESEPEYTARMLQEQPGLKPEQAMFTKELWDDSNNFRNIAGHKVVCWNNDHNRPFDESTAKRYSQEVLTRNWAGPTTFPGETVNGETLIVSRTGRVESGQHRGIGYMWAVETWRKQQMKWIPNWPDEPVFETIVVFGVSENPKVIRTLDNVRPRTSTDVIYTSGIFDRKADGTQTSSVEKKECSRMLAKAIDFLWQRTGAGGEAGQTKIYQTHAEALGFEERHPKLLDCVKHIFEENASRALSKLRISPGICAGMLYLMGSSSTDAETNAKYFSMEHRDESVLDWENWDRATEFWVTLASGAGEAIPITTALKSLVDEDGADGRMIEKVAILTKAWQMFSQHEPIEFATPPLKYTIRDGRTVLDEGPECSLGGIDIGLEKAKAAAEHVPTPEELEEAKKANRKAAAEELTSKLQGMRKTTPAPVAAKVPSKPLLLPAKNGPPPGPSATVAEPGQGKPPAPKLKVPGPFVPPVAKPKPIVRKT